MLSPPLAKTPTGGSSPSNGCRTAHAKQAFWRTGMFANQNSACKLTNKFTLEQLAEFLGLGDAYALKLVHAAA